MGIPGDETLTAVIALGKAAGTAAKPMRKTVREVLKFPKIYPLSLTPTYVI